MKLVAISRVRNERDIIEAFVRHQSHVFDQLIVLDDGSTDGTYEILRALQAERLPLVLIRDPAVGYEQSRYLSRLLHIAVKQYGADWVMPLDADEFVEPEQGRTLAQVLEAYDRRVLKVAWHGFVWRPQDDENAEANPVVRLRWRMPPSPDRLRKVLVPASIVEHTYLAQGNHELVRDGQVLPAQPIERVQLCHFPIRTVEQYASKVAVGYLQYSATPGWSRRDGFHYFEPYKLLTEGLDRLRQAMNLHSRRYSFEAEWPDVGEPREAPLDYKGGSLVFTSNATNMIGNILHCAETIAKKRVESVQQIRTAQEALLAANGASPDMISRIISQETEVSAVVHAVPHSRIGAQFGIGVQAVQQQTKHNFQSFWDGGPLTPYESLCLKSFIDCGHTLDLYTFDPNMRVPAGVRVRDAREFFSPDDFFVYSEGFGKGSPAAFANLFRYKLLAEKGGWWVDTDVICLAKDIPAFEFFFAWQDAELMNMAITYFEPRHPVMIRCFSEATKLGREVCWGETGPYLFTRIVTELGYAHRALASNVCYPVHYSEAAAILRPSRATSLAQRTAGSLFIHLWNEMLHHFGIEKTKLPPKGSILRGWIELHRINGWTGEYDTEGLERALLQKAEWPRRLTADLAVGIEEVGQTNTMLKTLNAALLDQNTMLQAERNILVSSNEQLGAERNILVSSNEQLRAERNTLVSSNEQLRAERDASAAVSEQLLKSTSWKLTAPVRTIGRAFNWTRRHNQT